MIQPATSRNLFLLAASFVVASATAFHAAALPSDESKPAGKGQAEAPAEPQYNKRGELKRPIGYERWVFVGANVGLEYKEDADDVEPAKEKKPVKLGDFHNVYINPEAFDHYVRTGTFPEKTVLVLDSYKSEEREPKSIVSEGLAPGRQTGLAVAVKNSARPDGGSSDWAYYDFGLDRTTAKAFPDNKCYDCHIQHASDDNVWVQFYPILRNAREKASKNR